MDHDLKMWFIVFVVATVVSVTIQLIHLIALCYVARRLQAKLKEFEQRAQSQVSLVQEYRTTAREVLETLKRSLDNAVELSERVKGIVNDAADASLKQWERTDRVIGDVLTRLERISQSLEAGVAKPIRETQAISAGLRAAFGAFVGHRGRTTATSPGTRKSSFRYALFCWCFSLPGAAYPLRLTPNKPVGWIPTKARRSQLWT